MGIPDVTKNFREAVFPGSEVPATTFNFMVSIGSRPFGDFRSVSGIKYTMPVEEIFEGGRSSSPHLVPFGGRGGAGKHGEVTLKWGSPVWAVLNDWMNAVKVGNYFRRDVFIVQLHRNGFPSRVLRLHKAWPVSWTAPDLDTGTSQVSMESLTLVFESCNMILTRANEMPSIDDLAATAGRLTRFMADTSGQVLGQLEEFGGDIADVFNGDAYDGMGEAYLDGVQGYNGYDWVPPAGTAGDSYDLGSDDPSVRARAWNEIFSVFGYGRTAARTNRPTATYAPLRARQND